MSYYARVFYLFFEIFCFCIEFRALEACFIAILKDLSKMAVISSLLIEKLLAETNVFAFSGFNSS